jgi:excisionase family DNA binding protein
LPRGIHSVKDAARSLGISEAHCRRLLETGKIQGTKLGHDWVVRVLKYKRKRKPKKLNSKS